MGPHVNERRLNGVKEMDAVMMFIAGERHITPHLVKPCKQCRNYPFKLVSCSVVFLLLKLNSDKNMQHFVFCY